MSHQAFSQRSIKEVAETMRANGQARLKCVGRLSDGTPIHVVVQLGHAMPLRLERPWRPGA